MEIRYRCKTQKPTPEVLKAQAARKKAHYAYLAKLTKIFAKRQARLTKALKKYQATSARCAYATASSSICKKFGCGRGRKCVLLKQEFVSKSAFRPICVAKPGVKCGKKNCRLGQKCELRHRFPEKVRTKTSARINKKIAEENAAYTKAKADAAKVFQNYLADFAKRTNKIIEKGFQQSCEHQVSILSCSTGFSINVLSAFYGRQSGSECHDGPIHTTSCSASTADAAVRKACQSKQSCTVEASNSVFGDPCVGTFKYMRINYQCKSNGPSASESKERSDRTLEYNNKIAQLDKLHGLKIANYKEELQKVNSQESVCVSPKKAKGPCHKVRCRRGRVCIARRKHKRLVARCAKPKALCLNTRCARSARCVVRRVLTRAARRFRRLRHRLSVRHAEKQNAVKAAFRKSALKSAVAFALAQKATKAALATAEQQKKEADVRKLKKKLASEAKAFSKKVRKQKRSLKKALRRLRRQYKREVSRLNRKYRKRRLVKHVARCITNHCHRVSCRSGFSCQNVKRFSEKYSAFLQEKRILKKAAWNVRKRLIESLYTRIRKSSSKFYKFLARHKADKKKAKSSSDRRKLRSALRRRVRRFKREQRTAYRKHRRALKKARKTFAKKLAALHKKHGKAAFKARVRTVARCIPKDYKSCRATKCSAGSRCIIKSVPYWWHKLYRGSLRSGNRKLSSRLLKEIKRFSHRKAQAKRRRQKRRREAAATFKRWFAHILKKHLGFGHKKSRKAKASAKKRPSLLWGSYKRATKRYRRKYRRIVSRLSRRKLRKYAKSHRRVRKSVYRHFRRNVKKYARRIASLKNRVKRQVRKLKDDYAKAKKATADDEKKLQKATVEAFNKIRKSYHKKLVKAVVSYYKHRVAIVKALSKRLRRFESKHSASRVVRRAFCVRANPCRGGCRRRFFCKVKKFKSKSGKHRVVGRCAKKFNPCSKVKCSSGKRCVVKRAPTRALKLYRWYSKLNKKRFNVRVRRLRKRLQRQKRRQAKKLAKKAKQLVKALAKKFKGAKLAKQSKKIKAELKKRLRKERLRFKRAFRKQRAQLRKHYKAAARRFYKKFMHRRRAFKAVAACVKKPSNPCTKNPCAKGFKCKLQRKRSSEHAKVFYRAIKKQFKRFRKARYDLANLSKRERKAALKKLVRKLYKKLAKIWKAHQRALRRPSFKAQCVKPKSSAKKP